MTAFGEETKPKLVDIAICALIDHFFPIEHIPPSGMDLIVDVNPRMLRCAAMPQYKSLIPVQGAFFGAAKQVIVDLISTMEKDHLLVV